jgi:hypothetical protein
LLILEYLYSLAPPPSRHRRRPRPGLPPRLHSSDSNPPPHPLHQKGRNRLRSRLRLRHHRIGFKTKAIIVKNIEGNEKRNEKGKGKTTTFGATTPSPEATTSSNPDPYSLPYPNQNIRSIRSPNPLTAPHFPLSPTLSYVKIGVGWPSPPGPLSHPARLAVGEVGEGWERGRRGIEGG